MMQGYEKFGKAITTYLACAVDRAADFGSTLCTWNYTAVEELYIHFLGKLYRWFGTAESDPFNPLRR